MLEQKAACARATSHDTWEHMALTATIYNFETELADIDRSVYETLSLRLARQPSTLTATSQKCSRN